MAFSVLNTIINCKSTVKVFLLRLSFCFGYIFSRVAAGVWNSVIFVGDSGGVPAGLFPAKAISKHGLFNNIKLTVFLKWVVHGNQWRRINS